ncbi:MAG: hypothetical protein VKK04_24815 [Synechococcales bacterium]|nr:hypothetical protein [Synechococcales bacterium]
MLLTAETETALPVEGAILPGLETVPTDAIAPALLDTSELVELVEALFDDEAAWIDDLADLAETVTGTVVFENGVVTANLASAEGDVMGTVDLVSEINELVDDLTGLTATATLSGGRLVGEILGLSSDDPLSDPFVFDLDLSSLVDITLTSLIQSWDDEFTVENGQIPINIPSTFGDITGTLSYLPGEVAIALTTPFGDIAETLPLPDGLVFSADGVVVDLDTGNALVDVLPQLPGGNITLPLSSLTYNVTVVDGIATVSVPTPLFGTFEAEFDLTPLVRDYFLTPFFAEAEGTLAIAEGILTSSFTTPYGTLEDTLDLTAFLTTLATDFSTLNGTLTFDGGTLVSDVTGSFGDFDDQK